MATHFPLGKRAMATLRSFKLRGKTVYQVDLGFDVLGKRIRKIYSVRKDAQKALKDFEKNQKKGDLWWGTKSLSERSSVAAICIDIERAGHTLLEVWSRFKEDKASDGSMITPKPFDDAVREWKAVKLGKGASQRYVDEAEQVFNRFAEGKTKEFVHRFTHLDLEAWEAKQAKTRKWGLSTKKDYRRIFSSLWSVFIRKGWTKNHICKRLEPIHAPPPDVRIYPNEIVLQLMAGALEDDVTRSVIAPLALGLFGCMRPEEISEPPEDAKIKPFGWNDIDLNAGRIPIRKGVGKKEDHRTIRLQPAAVEWLKLARKLGNPLPPVNERNAVDRICSIIGLEDWIRDGLRKCCATHLRWVYKNDYEVVQDLGNSVRVLLKHYAALNIPEEQSSDYWAITPKRVEEFRNSAAWKKLLKCASSKPNSSPAKRPKRSANETARSAS
jgi:integrase